MKLSSLFNEESVDEGVTRFGIAELYGQSFVALSTEKRRNLASFKPEKKSRLSRADRDRLLRYLFDRDHGTLSLRDQDRLNRLEEKHVQELTGNQICPFKSRPNAPTICTKDGGVCSLRLYQKNTEGKVIPVTGVRGGIRVTCPNRFHENNDIFAWSSKLILGTSRPALVGEVGFLSSDETLDGEEGGDVGRFDMIMIDPSVPHNHPLPWTALEIQAVYFSGKAMLSEFTGILDNIDHGGDGLIWPTEIRRPDYRSSGPKRLMPQLQIKIPTLRRWGKKMAVVIDRSFYESLGRMERVDEISNSDIAWFIVDFIENPDTGNFQLARGDVAYTTLEESVKGLTGGKPIPQNEFERKIKLKL